MPAATNGKRREATASTGTDAVDDGRQPPETDGWSPANGARRAFGMASSVALCQIGRNGTASVDNSSRSSRLRAAGSVSPASTPPPGKHKAPGARTYWLRRMTRKRSAWTMTPTTPRCVRPDVGWGIWWYMRGSRAVAGWRTSRPVNGPMGSCCEHSKREPVVRPISGTLCQWADVPLR